ncbi:dihydroorotase [Nakamurella multipartita]|uniref:Dihydroorotase n=1 Tax=Nakamurella multipartita (strain ATCC 700099 / DSM 44233 / CIP 104796 / JCM 9543 / NBRC 105858 / Y-104) TaxID=479431 RepID=C8XJK5_NAKMY|nr:dihydroorotase [Nakamurella multipartita]ACV80566.1 dihydroorotase, multifunctional complex type [Nakamurella multipartita DSM 44233]HOZ57160.1 dihydroorotase [Nakamurella multipartita]
MSVLITGGAPYGEQPADILVVDGVIAAVGADAAADPRARDAEVVDAAGLVVLPGLVDLHTHLREPGREDAETVATGSAAAALGGYTAVFAMPNTDPTADTAGVVEQVLRLGEQTGLVDVHPIGAVTVGRKGQKLAELAAMATSAARVRVFSDDGDCVSDPLLMRRALEYVKAFGGVIAQHAQEPRLTQGAQMHEGEVSARLGLTGWPAVAEEAIIARDCLLTDHVGSRLHVCHLSTAGSVEVVAAAKKRGTNVTAEVTPHHLLLTDERAQGYDPVFKVNPPLRTEADVRALRTGLATGVIDIVATDHAPHASQDKETEWDNASPGMLGLQTALSVVIATMVRTGLLDWRGVARVMAEAPARIGGLTDQGRPIAAGEPANLVLLDPQASWTVRGADFASLSRNTPFEGMELPGRVVATYLRGRRTASAGVALGAES